MQRQHGKLHNAGEDRHGAYGDIAAVFQQRGVEAYGNHAFTGLHDKCGGSQRHTGQDELWHQSDVLPLQPQQRFRPRQKPQHPDTGDSLRQNGCQSRAFDAHTQRKDKEGIQNNVGNRADQHSPHPDLCKALRRDKGVQSQRHLNEHRSHGIDPHIIRRVANGILAGAESQQQIPAPQQQNRCQHGGDTDLQGKAATQNFSAVS